MSRAEYCGTNHREASFTTRPLPELFGLSGYLLDELKNDITRETPASFEPSIDYVVTKIPHWRDALCLRGACARPPFRKPTPRSPRR